MPTKAKIIKIKNGVNTEVSTPFELHIGDKIRLLASESEGQLYLTAHLRGVSTVRIGKFNVKTGGWEFANKRRR